MNLFLPEKKAIRDETREALNKHGVFFKKRVVGALGENRVKIVSEEVGFNFGGTRVLDILAVRPWRGVEIHLSIECKKVFAKEKSWIFARDGDSSFRGSRWFPRGTSEEPTPKCNFAQQSPFIPVCSEGYEITEKGRESTADQKPIFDACNQLCAGYLGFLSTRREDTHRGGALEAEHHVPVLITNARLGVIESGFNDVDLQTGTTANEVQATEREFVVLKHPFPSPGEPELDFRFSVGEPYGKRHWPQMFKESVYVVNAAHLDSFLAQDTTDHIVGA